ncbi:trypsin-like serine peptidase [Kitasatospora sp. NPDC058965]|uniref:trypsin-like serine peptidase n=1 Tax=Kitasatospora sp. NPDC058965 TaxID=3346682 RepID=UPI0036932069
MSPINRARRSPVAAAGAAAVVLALFTVTACGPDETQNPPPAASSAAASPSPATGLPAGLPSLDVLKKWKFEDWDNWAKQHVITPAAKGFWDLEKMLLAKPTTPVAPPQQPTDDGNDPLPAPIQAKAMTHPYTPQYGVDGKVFFDVGDGKHAVCSATVISDPEHPGKSNLVWTAGHCLTAGKSGQQYTNIAFVPAFNSSGAVSHGQRAKADQFAPFGIWDATQAITSPQWTAEGGEYGSAASQYDFAILRVQSESASGKSLEETVGGSVPVWFNAPRDQLKITAVGYPAAPPFDGMEMERCEAGKPSRLSFDKTRPPMNVIGCTMTAGSSGGGWFAVKDGKPALVSNTSIGPENSSWLAGPYLDDVAAHALDYIAKKG